VHWCLKSVSALVFDAAGTTGSATTKRATLVIVTSTLTLWIWNRNGRSGGKSIADDRTRSAHIRQFLFLLAVEPQETCGHDLVLFRLMLGFDRGNELDKRVPVDELLSKDLSELLKLESEVDDRNLSMLHEKL
jgi:hypothetical protein